MKQTIISFTQQKKKTEEEAEYTYCICRDLGSPRGLADMRRSTFYRVATASAYRTVRPTDPWRSQQQNSVDARGRPYDVENNGESQ
jgi:hypothetical protein